MHHAVGQTVGGDQRLDGRWQIRGVVDVDRDRGRVVQPMLPHERRGATGQVDADDRRALGIELPRDRRPEMAGPAGDPDALESEGEGGGHG